MSSAIDALLARYIKQLKALKSQASGIEKAIARTEAKIEAIKEVLSTEQTDKSVTNSPA